MLNRQDIFRSRGVTLDLFISSDLSELFLTSCYFGERTFLLHVVVLLTTRSFIVLILSLKSQTDLKAETRYILRNLILTCVSILIFPCTVGPFNYFEGRSTFVGGFIWLFLGTFLLLFSVFVACRRQK